MTTPIIHDSLTSPDPGHKSGTKATHAAGTVKTLPTAWIRADDLFRQANALYWEPPTIDHPRLERVFEVGRRLQQAKELLGNVDFEGTLDVGCKIEFSSTSARRYLRLARHADAIRAAGVTNVMVASQLARRLDYGQFEEANDSATTPTPSTATTLASETESSVFNDMRRLPAADQPVFVADILGRLTRLHSLFT